MATTKYTPSLVLLFHLVLLSQVVFAQSYTISGTLQDSLTKEPIFGATIAAAVQQDSTAAKLGCISDEEGKFSLQLSKGNYQVQFSHVGYSTMAVKLRVDSSQWLGIFYLGEKTLEDVVVERQVIAVLQRGDTTVFNAEAFKTRANASTRELIRKMPGMQTEGQLKAQGEEVVEILVDGKPFSSQNQEEVLNNLPAAMVEKVELYKYQSEHDRASGIQNETNKKTINIVTKKKFRESIFGEGQLAAGTNPTPLPLYYAEARLNSFRNKQRAGIQLYAKNVLGTKPENSSSQLTPQHQIMANFNDSWEKTSFSMAYNLNQHQKREKTQLHRTNLFIDSLGKYYEEYATTQNNSLSHFGRFQLEHNKKQHRLTFQVTGQFSSGKTLSDNKMSLFDQNNILGIQSNQLNVGANNSFRYTTNLLYSYRFSKKGRGLTLSLHSKQQWQNDSTQRTLQHYEFMGTSSGDSSNHQKINDHGKNEQLDAKLSYTEPLGEWGQLQLQANFQVEFARQEKYNYSLPQQSYSDQYLDTSLSTISKRRVFSYELNPAYNYKKGKFNFNLSFNTVLENIVLREELDNSDTQLKYIRLRPNTRFRWQLDKKAYLQISYNMRTRNPNMREQQGVIDNNNPTVLYKGNPHLRMEVEHTASLLWNRTHPEKGNSIMGQLHSSFYQSKIANSLYVFSRDTSIEGLALGRGIQLFLPVNLSGGYRIQTMFNYHQQIKKIPSNFSCNLIAMYERTPSLYNGERRHSNQFNALTTLSLTSNIGKQVDINAVLTGIATFISNENAVGNMLWQQSFNLTAFWRPFKRFYLQTALYQQYTNSTRDFILNWNMGIGANVLKKEQGEIALLYYNILNQNNNRQVLSTAVYNEVLQNQNLLGPYILLRFTYHLQPTPLKSPKKENGS